MRNLLLTIAGLFACQVNLLAQCCSGGSGSPIAGGISQGVIMEQQFELNTNYQFISSNRFFTGSKPDTNKYFDKFSSTYQYFRIAYGLSSKLMLSVETGYYLNKEEVGLHNDPTKTYSTSGLSDLIIFPRYDVLNRSTLKTKTEITLGLGYKIPLGSYNDSTGNIEPFSGNTYYVTNPQAVQLTSGAQDIIFYSFFYRGYPIKNFRVFANALYIKKGWNPLGEKIGDFASLSLFAGKTFYNKLGATLQVRGEWVDQMKLNKEILLYAYPNYDPEATGYKKIFVTPQLSYTRGKISMYALADLPVYQYVNKTQVGSQLQITAGLSYRFFAMKSKKNTSGYGEYVCPMHPQVTASYKGKCPECGMDLVNKKK
jgi:hypothetical protein